jgi:hypothetical protein
VRRLLKCSIASSMGLIVAAAFGMGQVPSQKDNGRSETSALEQQGRWSEAEVAWQAIAKGSRCRQA